MVIKTTIETTGFALKQEAYCHKVVSIVVKNFTVV